MTDCAGDERSEAHRKRYGVSAVRGSLIACILRCDVNYPIVAPTRRSVVDSDAVTRAPGLIGVIGTKDLSSTQFERGHNVCVWKDH